MGRAFTVIMSLAFLLAGCSFDLPPYEEDFIHVDSVAEAGYFGVPRFFIYTQDKKPVVDRETEIPATLSIYGKDTSLQEKYDLTIRGRGNTSWEQIPKKNYKIEFSEKVSLLGMPQNKDWVLIPNYSDKTLIKNYIAYTLSVNLGAYYSPRGDFVELYLNGEYLGLYYLSEKIKEGKNRINLPKDTPSFIVEIDNKYREDEQVLISNLKQPFRVHYPKNASDEELDTLLKQINLIENALILSTRDSTVRVSKWIDLDDYIKHFWIQEFMKNPDATFYSSVYFSWTVGKTIKMGPVWDFDISAGGHTNDEASSPEGWLTKDIYWNHYLFYREQFSEQVFDFWKENRSKFLAVLDTIEQCRTRLKAAAEHNFTKWMILQEKDDLLFNSAYSSYDEAIDKAKEWFQRRIDWISKQKM